MEHAVVRPGNPLIGIAAVPGDKSISHRALILASQSRGENSIHGISRGSDVRDTARALGALGVKIGPWEEDPLVLTGVGLGGWTEPRDVLDFGNSGTGIRLMAGMLAGHPFFSVLTGDSSLRRRPMGRIVEPLRLMGARIDGRRGGEAAPLAIRGGALRGISYRSPVASAQLKSAVLLAGLLAEGETLIREPALSRDHTERMLRHLGVDLEREDGAIRIKARREWAGGAFTIPGDPSAAAFLVAAALIVPGSEVTVRNVCVNPTRLGFFEIIRAMGADCVFTNSRVSGGEPLADVKVKTSSLRGISVPAELVPRGIDEFPVLAALALFARGKTVITAASELRVKESDRIHTMANELSRFGGRVRELPDGLEVEGGGNLAGAECDSHGDHRVAMSLAVAGLALSGMTAIRDIACVGTSFPAFWETLRRIGGEAFPR